MTQPPLKELIFTLLNRCPSWCDYCYNAKNVCNSTITQTFLHNDNQLRFKNICNMINQALPLGLKKIQLSGGEPLLAPSLVSDIIKFASLRGIYITLYTNGYLLNSEIAKLLSELGLNEARISIGGPNYQAHSIHRHDPAGRKSWQKIVQSINLFRKVGIKVGTLVPIVKTSISFLRETAEFSFDIGSEYIVFHRYIPSGIDVQDRICNLTPEQHMKAVDEILRTREILCKHDEIICDYGLFEFLSKYWTQKEYIKKARCGRTRLGVLADGNISTCSCGSVKLSSIYQENFDLKDLWHTHPFLLNIRHSNPESPCDQCKWYHLCMGACPSYSKFPEQSPTKPSVCPIVVIYEKLCSSMSKEFAAIESLQTFDANKPNKLYTEIRV